MIKFHTVSTTSVSIFDMEVESKLNQGYSIRDIVTLQSENNDRVTHVAYMYKAS